MSIHPSLGAAAKGKQQKSVLKRTERIKHMVSKGLWTENSKVFGLPKIKALRIKVIKKEKAADKTAEAGATATATGAPSASSTDQKSKTAAKK